MLFGFEVFLPNPILTQPERSGRFGKQTGKLFERSEFLPVPKTAAERREPAAGGPVSWVPFLCFLSLGKQRKEGVARGRNPGLNSPKQHHSSKRSKQRK